MKKTKIIVPALGMLLLSTAASVTGTVAWFSANATVTASGMQVKAKADKGILINEVETSADAHWDDTALAGQASAIEIRPTSTADTGTWYTASSKSSSDAAGAGSGSASSNLSGTYKTLASLSATTNTTAAVAGTSARRDICYVDDDGTAGYGNGEGYYVKYTYYIKSSSEAITCGLASGDNNLNIKQVTAQALTSNSTALNKALRVAVVVNSKAYIFAPISTDTTTYYVAAGSDPTTVLSGAQATSLTSIPSKQDDGVAVYVYVYFEGEDANCKTDNVTATLDALDVSVQFGLVTNDAAKTDNGVAVGA